MSGPGQNASASARARLSKRAIRSAASMPAACRMSGVGSGPALGGIDRGHGGIVRRIGPEAVDSLGGKGYEPPRLEMAHRCGDGLGTRRNDEGLWHEGDLVPFRQDR